MAFQCGSCLEDPADAEAADGAVDEDAGVAAVSPTAADAAETLPGSPDAGWLQAEFSGDRCAVEARDGTAEDDVAALLAPMMLEWTWQLPRWLV